MLRATRKGVIKMEESFKTSSGREVTVNISDDGEPENVVIDGVVISENELLEIAEYVQEYPENDDDE